MVFFQNIQRQLTVLSGYYKKRNTSDPSKMHSTLVCGPIAYLCPRGLIFIRFAKSFCPSGWLCLQNFFCVFKDWAANTNVNADRMCEWCQSICISSSTHVSFKAIRVKSLQDIKKICCLLFEGEVYYNVCSPFLTFLPSFLVQFFLSVDVIYNSVRSLHGFSYNCFPLNAPWLNMKNSNLLFCCSNSGC